MRIAFDLRYADEHFTGIGRLACATLVSLLERHPDDRFDVLWRPGARTELDLEPIRRDPRVNWVELASHPLAALDPLRLGARLRRLRSDVYLSPFWRAPVAAGMPLVLTLHDVLPFQNPAGTDPARRLAMRLTIGWWARRAEWLTVSEWSRGEMIRLTAIPAARVHVYRNYQPPRDASGAGRRPAGFPDGPFALAVGVNKPHKNLAMLPAAWERGRLGERLRLVWAGPRDPRHPAPGDTAGADGTIVALGRVADEELAWLYRHAVVLLFPTLDEGFGLPLLEAMTVGLPAIVSDIPVLHEVGGAAAVFVAPCDPAAWADAIVRLMDDPAECARLAEAGPRRARAFDGRADAGMLSALLARLAGGRR